jgi:hypothetical protein
LLSDRTRSRKLCSSLADVVFDGDNVAGAVSPLLSAGTLAGLDRGTVTAGAGAAGVDAAGGEFKKAAKSKSLVAAAAGDATVARTDATGLLLGTLTAGTGAAATADGAAGTALI